MSLLGQCCSSRRRKTSLFCLPPGLTRSLLAVAAWLSSEKMLKTARISIGQLRLPPASSSIAGPRSSKGSRILSSHVPLESHTLEVPSHVPQIPSLLSASPGSGVPWRAAQSPLLREGVSGFLHFSVWRLFGFDFTLYGLMF